MKKSGMKNVKWGGGLAEFLGTFLVVGRRRGKYATFRGLPRGAKWSFREFGPGRPGYWFFWHFGHIRRDPRGWAFFFFLEEPL